MNTENKLPETKYECLKTVRLDGGRKKCFVKGKIYSRISPEVYPSADSQICLRDEQEDEHFMDGKFLRKHFKKATLIEQNL